MNYRTLMLMIAALAVAGCVTGRRTFELPVNARVAPVPTRSSVYIASVTDDRQFQNKPSDPSIPSVHGDVTKLSADQRDHMIGRQRNTYGKAIGDVSLPENDSVERRVLLLVEQGLRQSGYRISTDPSAPNSITVSIRKFWGWMTPGFFALTFEAQIECAVSAKGPAGLHTVVVSGYGLNHGQFAKDENWLEAFEPAFDDFVTKLAAESGNLRLPDADSAPAQR